MGYMHIDNLYRNQTVLQFKRGYALEKIHGTSAHVRVRIDALAPTDWYPVRIVVDHE